MNRLSDVVEWKLKETLDGDVSVTGEVKVSAVALVSGHVRYDLDVMEDAKQAVVWAIHRELYGNMEKHLARLERILMITLQSQYATVNPQDDGPMAIVRELQAELQARR